MNPDTAKAAMAFLSRTTLQGAEVPAFNQVMLELEKISSPPIAEKSEE